MELENLIKELHERTLLKNETALAYADAKQVYQRLDDLKKTVLSKVKLNILKESNFKMPNNTADTCALASDEYIEFIETLAKAREVFLKLEAEKGADENRVTALITLISLEKAKMQLY